MFYVILNKDGTFQNKAGKPVIRFAEAHITSDTPVRDDQFYIEVHTLHELEICPDSDTVVILRNDGYYYSENGPVESLQRARVFHGLPGIGGIRIPVKTIPKQCLIGSLRPHDDIS